MLIPPDALAPATLRNLVEEFVTREGTDYGDYHHTLADKVAQVLKQLEQGSIVILYDPHTNSCH
ncbi:MAG TPA: YheU family protein, partial [Hyphomicrobiales bacterium]|nr:YheU family protein [Hyphomicrobiales bacterium]